MRKFAFFAALVLLSGVIFGQQAEITQATRIDFSSAPEGANVYVDGVLRGVTPLSLFDLRPGQHHVSWSRRHFESADSFIQVESGVYASHYAELQPVKGLLLVRTEPAGCDVSLDGLSFGETPRLITTLNVGQRYRLLLQKAGYQSRTVDVRFDGRTPLVKFEKLILDSGVLKITSEPAGAQVTVNGLPRGVTPLMVKEVPKGRATVSLKLDGYVEETRELSLNAGDEQTVFIKMDGLPGSLVVSAIPDTARIYVDDVLQGKGRQTIRNMKPGAYEVRVEQEGYGTLKRSVTIGNGAEVFEEFRLENVMGRLEIRTAPAGAKIYVDNRLCGTTVKSDPLAMYSDVLTISNLESGERTILVKAAGYADTIRHPIIEASQTTQEKVKLKRLFIPDFVVETESGRTEGVYVNQNEAAITIEVSPGVERSFPRSSIRKFGWLDINK